jgi:hypothetical protein
VKKSLTLVLLVLFLFNVLGYYGVFVGLQFANEREMKALFDDTNFLPEEEITIKVPITIPYATDSREFSRVDGEFEHDGEVYRMVKQRYIGDTLYMVCVKDNNSKEIKQKRAGQKQFTTLLKIIFQPPPIFSQKITAGITYSLSVRTPPCLNPL